MRMDYQQQQTERSFVEVRLLVLFAVGFLLLALGLPSLLRALDTNGDNLDDTWETQYGITTGAYASTNLVGWWQLNGTNSTNPATDRSGNGITGTLSGFPSVAYGTGLFSNALYFTTNGTVSFPTTNSALNATNQFTFSAWFQATNNLSLPATIATWSDAATNGWSVGVATNGVANVTFFDGATVQVVQATTGAVNLYDGSWHEVAATYNTNQAATVYVDGAGEVTNTITGWTPGTVSSFTMGVPNSSTTNNPYALDEARLYNRSMGATEIPQLPVTYADLNGSGLSVFQDYLESLNPLSTTSIVTSGFLSSGLTAYYGGSNPTLTKTGGDMQTVSASTFATNALVVHVTNGSGTALVGAPITFSIPITSDGGIALTSGGTTTTSLSMTTDGSGNATVYYKSGAEVLLNNTIQATAVSTAGSVSVTFTEYCGVQSGLSMWLRTDVGVTSSSGNVSGWADQTSNGNNAFQATGSLKPTLTTNSVNGKPGITFDGTGHYLRITETSSLRPSSAMTLIVVSKPKSTSPYYSTVFNRPYRSDTTWNTPYYSYGLWQTPSNYLYTPLSTLTGTNPKNLTASLPFDTKNAYVATQVYNGSTQSLYIDGTLNGSQSVSGNIDYNGTTAIDLAVGASSPYAPYYWYTGDVLEILFYSRALTSTEIQQVDAYLADKYGTYDPNATWPSAYSSEVQGEITRNQWNKTQADAYVTLETNNSTMLTHGLLFWCKADAGVTQSSGAVSAWADQTGNFTVTQGTSGNKPTYVTNDINGEPALRFNGSQWLYNAISLAPGLNADMTIIEVGSTSTPGAHEVSLWLGGTGTGQERGLGYYNGLELGDTGNIYASGVAAPTPNLFVAEMTTLNSARTSLTFYRNGTQTGTATLSGVQNLLPSITVGAFAGSSSYGWQGDIAETLVYDHKLSSTELQQVGVYLADKYGLYNPNATWPSAYSSEVQGEITRNQWNKTQADAYVTLETSNSTMLTHGLLFWCKADAGVTQSSGAVSAWVDQTGNFTVTQATSGNKPTYVASDINGKPALRFSGSQWLVNPSNIGAGVNSDLTLITVGSTTTPTAQQYTLWLGGTASSQNRGIGYYSNAEMFDTYNTWCGGAIAASANLFSTEVGELDSTRSNVTFYRNGVQTATGTLSGLQNVPAGISVGALAGQTFGWKGDIAETLVYDHKLSSTELQQVGVYLADKYGLYNPNATWPSTYSSAVQSEITRNQWNKSQADAYVTFLGTTPAVPATGLVTWLKADAGVTSSSGNVSAWADQSPAGNNAVQATGGNQPTLVTSAINGKPALSFNGTSSYLTVTDNTSLRLANVTILAVAIRNGGTDYGRIVSKPYFNTSGQWNGPYVAYDLSRDPNGVPYMSCTVGGSNLGVNVGVPMNSGPAYLFSATYDGTTESVRQNGASPLTRSASGSIDNGDATRKDLVIGGSSVYWPYQDFPGKIAEVLIYNRALTDTERQQAEVYLADKYGVYHPYATWPSSYSSAVQSEITRNQWNKSQADAYVAFLATSPVVPPTGLVTWLKADAGVTSSSGNVSAWADQSPTGNSAVQATSGNQPTLVTSAINGKPALSFNGTSSYLTVADNTSLRPTNVTILAVATRNGGTDYGRIVSKPYFSTSGQWNGPYVAYDLSRDPGGVPYMSCTVGGSNLGVNVGVPMNSGPAYLFSSTYDGTTESLRQNGYTPSTRSVSGTIDNGDATRKDLVIGGSSVYWPYQNFPGQIAEVLIYNRALTDTERQQAETYLANKYGISYYGLAPTISPNGGSYTGTQSVAITSNQSVGTLHYTLDGTEPTVTSPTYTSAITLSGSALVNAAVFSTSGQQLSQMGSAQFYVNDTGSTGLPTAPTSLGTTVVSASEIDLAWTLSGQLNYYGVAVWRSSDGGTTYQLVAVLDPSATSYADTNVVSGTNYQYIVGTDNTSGESDTSATSSVTPTSATTWTTTVTTPSGATSLP